MYEFYFSEKQEIFVVAIRHQFTGMASSHFESVLSEYSCLVGKTFTGFYEETKIFYQAVRHKVIVYDGEIMKVLQRIVDSDENDRVWKGLYRNKCSQFIMWAYRIEEPEDSSEVPGGVSVGKRYEFVVTGFGEFDITERADKFDGGVSIHLKVIRELHV